jgi:hypothetical protein
MFLNCPLLDIDRIRMIGCFQRSHLKRDGDVPVSGQLKNAGKMVGGQL